MNATLGLLPSYFQNSADQAIYYHNQTNERNYRAFSSFYGTVSWLCFVLGVMLNFLLIWLIIKKTHGEMKAYSKILLQTCVLDLYTLTMAVVVQPIYIMLEGNNIMLQNGFFREASQPLNFIVGELWVFGYYFSIISIVIQFIYKYLVLCKGVKTTVTLQLAMVFVGASLIWGYNGMLYYAMYPRKELPEPLVSIIRSYFDYDKSVEPIQITMIGRPDSLRCIAHCAYIFSIEVVCYATIIICGIKVKQYVKKATLSQTLNFRVLELNKQLNYTLAIQALLPLAAVLIGVFCIFVCTLAAFVGSYLSFYFISYMTVPVPWIPVLNPLITLLLVKQYRMIVFGGRQSSFVSFTQNKNSIGATKSIIT